MGRRAAHRRLVGAAAAAQKKHFQKEIPLKCDEKTAAGAWAPHLARAPPPLPSAPPAPRTSRALPRAAAATMPRKDKKAAKKAAAAAAEPAAEAAAAAPEAWTCPECMYEHEGEEAAEEKCLACEAPRPARPGGGDDDEGEGDEQQRFKGFKVGQIEAVEELAGKLSAITVDVGAGEPLNVVTSAPYMAEGQRVCIATVGATITQKGDEVVVKKTTVGGRKSEGIVCDSPMLGWVGGAAGNAAFLPESFKPGDAPPSRRPRMDGK